MAIIRYKYQKQDTETFLGEYKGDIAPEVGQLMEFPDYKKNKAFSVKQVVHSIERTVQSYQTQTLVVTVIVGDLAHPGVEDMRNQYFVKKKECDMYREALLEIDETYTSSHSDDLGVACHAMDDIATKALKECE